MLNASTTAPADMLFVEIAEIIDQAHADLDEHFADAEHTGERPDLQDSETMIPVDLLKRLQAYLHALTAERDALRVEAAAYHDAYEGEKQGRQQLQEHLCLNPTAK